MRSLTSRSCSEALSALSTPVVRIAALALAIAGPNLGFAQTYTTNAVTNNWSNAASWSGAAAGAGAVGATVTKTGTGSTVLTLDIASSTMGAFKMENGSSFQVTTGANALTFDVSSGFAEIANTSATNNARIYFYSGNGTTTGTFNLHDDLKITNTATATGTTGSMLFSNIKMVGTGTTNLTISNVNNSTTLGQLRFEFGVSPDQGVGLTDFTGNVLVEKGAMLFNYGTVFGGKQTNTLTLGTTDGGGVTVVANRTSQAVNVANNIVVAAGTGGTTILGARAAVANTVTSTTSYNGDVTLNGDLSVDASQVSATSTSGNVVVALTGAIGGSGGLTAMNFSNTGTGTTTVQLTGANSYSGQTRVTGGTLQIGANSGTDSLALQSSTVNLATGDTGALQFGTSAATTITSATFGGLTGTRNLALQNINSTPAAVALKVGKVGGSTTYDGVLSGAGSLEIVNGGALTLSAAQQYTGTTTVTNGTLVLNGSTHASSALTVAEDGVLGGIGTINGAATIGGTHNPGNSPGIQTFANDLTYTAGATVNWELTANTITQGNPTAVFDQVMVGGTLNFAGATSLNLSFNGAGSTVSWGDAFWNSERSWLIYDNASLSNFSNFSLTSGNWADGAGGLFATLRPDSAFSLSSVDGNVFLNYTAVPEPSTYAAIVGALALGAVALMRRRRSRDG